MIWAFFLVTPRLNDALVTLFSPCEGQNSPRMKQQQSLSGVVIDGCFFSPTGSAQ